MRDKSVDARSVGLLLLLMTANGIALALLARGGWHGALVLAAIAMASLASSIAGFAFSAICGAMLFHLSDDPVHLVQIMISCSVANQAAMTWAARRQIDWRGLSIYLAGGALGLPLGVWALLHTPRAVYVPVLGALLLAYGTVMLLRRPGILLLQHPILDMGIGVLGGVTGGAAGFPGASVTIWCGVKGWDKARQRAMFQPFILIMQIAALLSINLAQPIAAVHGHFTPTDLLFIPAGLLGTMIGLRLYSRLNDRQFARAVNVLLMVSGLSYII